MLTIVHVFCVAHGGGPPTLSPGRQDLKTSARLFENFFDDEAHEREGSSKKAPFIANWGQGRAGTFPSFFLSSKAPGPTTPRLERRESSSR